ncbi:hypothetical protein ASPCADRAFT_402239 [Aspergillus carbonarius ITEM 5010]|uniref:Uncharacterized protein n=1 Tax=Aspergillus carbonarius (strain ITEM 5010) TaxID=602072 RepID=A0A1R3RYC8_ASPC5|nr:hypothetical protein ASPCADRAFT_402239 [Aspergillus carbonarius ITEM 5010]
MPLTISPIINSKHNPTFTPTPTSISTTQSPSSLISTPTPARSQIWPLSLRTIKHLYISHHYRQCIARVEDLLPLTEEPIHKTYLTFYTAMSYEGMGLAAHNYSKNKLPLLQAAVEWFVVCRAWVVGASVASDTSVQEEGGRGERDRDKHRYSDTDSEYEDTDRDKGDTLERSITQMIQGIDLHGRDPFEDDPFIDREDSDPELDLDRENAGDEWMAIQVLDSHSDTFQGSSSPTLNDSDSDSDTPNNSYITDSPNEPIYTSTEQGLIPSPLKVRKASGESFEAEILRQSGLNLDPDLEHVQIQKSLSQYRKLPSVGGSRFVPPLPVRVIPASTTTPGYHSGSGTTTSTTSNPNPKPTTPIRRKKRY